MISKESVLMELHNEFSENEQLTELSMKADNEIVDMVITEFRGVGKNDSEVLAELFFNPQPIADPMYEIFTIALTYEDEYKGKNRDALLNVLNFINANMPLGAFTIDNTGTVLGVKYTLPVELDTEIDKLMKMINYSIASLVAYTGLWMDVVLDVIKGNADMEDVKKILNV